MKKRITIFLLLMILFSFVTAENITINKTNEENITINKTNEENIIEQFIQQDIQSNFLKFIGLPESITLSKLIIYLLVCLIFLSAFFDILNGFSSFSTIASFGISAGMTLMLITTGLIYTLTQKITNIKFTKYILIVAICIYILLKMIAPRIIKMNRKNEQARKNIEARVRSQKIKTTLDAIKYIGDGIQ